MSGWTRWGILAAAAAVSVSCSAPALRGRVAEGRYAFPDGVVSCPVPESMDGIQDGPNAVSLYQSGRFALYYGTWYSLFYVPLDEEEQRPAGAGRTREELLQDHLRQILLPRLQKNSPDAHIERVEFLEDFRGGAVYARLYFPGQLSDDDERSIRIDESPPGFLARRWGMGLFALVTLGLPAFLDLTRQPAFSDEMHGVILFVEPPHLFAAATRVQGGSIPPQLQREDRDRSALADTKARMLRFAGDIHVHAAAD